MNYNRSNPNGSVDIELADETIDILDAISYGLAIINMHGEILHINAAAARLFGYSKEDATGNLMAELFIAEKDRPKFFKILESLHTCNIIESIKFMSRHQDGNEFPAIVSLSVIKDSDYPVKVAAIFREISEYSPALEDTEKRKTELLQSRNMEAIGMLACSIAHDFSKIVTAINNFSHLGMKQFEGSAPLAYDIFANIKTASCRATNLIRQLLTFSHSKPSRHDILDMNRLINDLLQMLNCIISDGISLKLDLDTGLRMIMGDTGKMEQVILNLVVNARDAMPQGGTITIRTENVILDKTHCAVMPLARPGQFILLKVTDTGSGISKDHIKHIFDPFFTTKKSIDSAGLGLSVVYDIIEEHKGWINILSEEGKGTTFEVFLPVVLS